MADRDAQGYVLGTAAAERERLLLQHELWQPLAAAAWQRAGLKAGQRVLDLGAGPGDAALDLARAVGPGGRVVALEQSPGYGAEARQAAAAAGLDWLEVLQADLGSPGQPRPWQGDAGFDLAWCRWLVMFLPRLEPLIALLRDALRPGGRVVLHEYVQWDSFGLYPGGAAVTRFVQTVRRSFVAAGGDPDPARRLPELLLQAGFALEELRPLPVLGRLGDPWALWLERFVTTYGAQLIARGLWSEAEAGAAAEEMARARSAPGWFWVGPTVLEIRARRI